MFGLGLGETGELAHEVLLHSAASLTNSVPAPHLALPRGRSLTTHSTSSSLSSSAAK